jgi:aminopeptidase N
MSAAAPCRRVRVLVAAAIAVVLVAGCGPDDPDVRAVRSDTTANGSGAPASTSPSTSVEPGAPPTTDDSGGVEPAEPTTPSSPAPSDPPPSADGIGDRLFPDLGNPGLDVREYDVAIEYDPALDTIAGDVALTIRFTESRPTFTLDAIGLEVAEVSVDGASAAFEIDDPELRITPTSPPPIGTDVVVRVRYTQTPDPQGSVIGLPNGWFHTEGVDGLGGSYVLNQPDGARTWLPANDHPSDKASWTFRVTVPDPLVAVANGVLDRERTGPSEDGSTTWVWRQAEPMPTYLVQLMTGAYEFVESTGPDGVPLFSVVLAGDRARMEPYLSTIDDQIDFFDDLFGPYPLEAYGIAMTDSFSGLAMETQGRSLFSRDDFTGASGYLQELLLAHELTHMWFGDAVSPARWTDIWLNESFATYGQWLWLDHIGISALADEAAFALSGRQGDVGFPAGSPTATPSADEMFGFNSYDGGAVILHALRLTVGDDEFFEVLRRWAAENTFESRTTDDFLALAADVTGRDLDAFWQDWLFATDLPDEFPSPGEGT